MAEAVPSRITILWSPEARADLRAIDRKTAVDILHCIDRYLTARTGDVKKLRPPQSGFRLRCGDYRIFFEQPGELRIIRYRRKKSPGSLPLRLSCRDRSSRLFVAKGFHGIEAGGADRGHHSAYQADDHQDHRCYQNSGWGNQ